MGTSGDGLGEAAYRRLRRATETHRTDLVVRLAGEVGLRPAEIARLRPGDVRVRDGSHLLSVRGERARTAYLPAGVEHDLRKYARAADVTPDEPLFDVSARRIQMLVREVADRAGLDVSSRDLRRRFAREALDDGVPAPIVRDVGGYESLDALAGLIEPPDEDAVVAAFEDQRGPPGRLRQTLAVAADVGEALAGATTREAVEAAVCERLADADGYNFAWIAEATGGALIDREAAGIDEDAVATMLAELSPTDTTDVRPDGDGSLALVPLVHDGDVRGMLGVGAGHRVGEAEQDLLAMLGAQIGHALSAVEHRRLLVADAVTELTLRTTDGPLAALSATLDAEVTVSGLVPVEQGLLSFTTVAGASTDPAMAAAVDDDRVTAARLVEDHGDGALLELIVGTSPARTLVDAGARVREAAADDGATRLVAETGSAAEAREVVGAVTEAFPGTRLLAKRETERPVETDAGFRERVADRLTDKQRTALEAAYHGGYFEWPRESTAEELAASLDVASPTLHNHLRIAQQKVLAALLDGQSTVE